MKQDKIIYTQAQDVSTSTYDKVPISGFGLSLMESMGFSESRGIGRTNKGGLQEPLVLKPRPKGLGLGANPEGFIQDEEIKIEVGQNVVITKGVHKDLVGRVIKVSVEEESCLVQLRVSQENVRVSVKDVREVSKEEIKQREKEKQKGKQEDKGSKKKRIKWVIPGIEVKVVDNTSPLYLKKIEVTEILDEYSFECRTAEGRTVGTLGEKQLQTVVPGVGEEVIVVRGERRGTRGRVQMRDKREHKVIIQTLQEFEALEFGEDDICKYRF